MEITEVRIKLIEDTDDRLQAFCSITFDDCFVVRDLKIIDGSNGPFVAMPSRKLTSHCSRCGSKNHLRSAYCNQCGAKLRDDRSGRDHEGRAKLYADIAHPINSQCRELIQNHVIAEYEAELDRAKQPGYKSRYDEGYDEPDYDVPEAAESKPSRLEHARAEPAEAPRGPHTPPSRRTGTGQGSQQRSRTRRGKTQSEPKSGEGDEFGAGVFD